MSDFCSAEYSSCPWNWPWNFPGGASGGGGSGGGGGNGYVSNKGPEGTGPWITAKQRQDNVLLLQGLAAAAVAAFRQSSPVVHLLLSRDCLQFHNPDNLGISRNRTYQAFDQFNHYLGDAKITERVLDVNGGITGQTGAPLSSGIGTFADRFGLGLLQSEIYQFQYFVTSLPGTGWTNVPTQVETPKDFYFLGSSASTVMVQTMYGKKAAGQIILDINEIGAGGLKPCP